MLVWLCFPTQEKEKGKEKGEKKKRSKKKRERKKEGKEKEKEVKETCCINYAAENRDSWQPQLVNHSAPNAIISYQYTYV